jgi:PAS domain S-box-containing protein
VKPALIESAGRAEGVLAVANSAPIGIFEVSHLGECRFVNDRWCELAGVSRESALGRGWERAIHPNDRDEVIARWEAAAVQRRDFVHEYRYLRPDGEAVWVNVRANGVADDSGRVSSYVGFVIDVTDRRRAEAELEESEHRYRSTVESIDDVVFRTDREGRWTFLNPAWTTHTGYGVAQSIGRRFTDYVLEEDLPLVEQALAPLVDGTEEAVRYAHRYRSPAGEVRWADVSVRRVSNGSPETSGYAGTLTDITDRRDADAAMRMLAAIVDSSAAAIIGRDLEGTITSWNPGAERMYGYSAEEMIGRSIEVLVPPGHPNELPEILRRVGAGERIEHLETVRMRKDWRRIEVALTISPIRDEHGDVVGISTVARDITEEKAAERRLAESSRHFELSHDLVATCGFDGYFKQLNGSWEPTLGWSPSDLLPNPFIEVVHPDDRAAVVAEVAKLAQGGKTIEFRLRAATKDGGWRWTEWSAMPDVEAGLFFASGRDVTDRVEADRALERERRQLAEAQELASVGSWEIELDTGESVWSAQQARNHGFEPAPTSPAVPEFADRIHADDRERLAELLASAIAEPREFTTEYRVQIPGEGIREIELHGRPGTDPDGRAMLVGTSRDVTVERDAERLKDQFFGLISHELRTPLTSIIGYAELLSEIESENLSGQGRRFLEVIERNSRRELSLVGDLLLLTKITAGTFAIEVGRADVAEIAAAAVEAARPAAGRTGVELVLEAAGESVVAGDAHRLGQVIENLVSNAIKFTPDGGSVVVRVEPDGEGVAFEVEDSGIGIAQGDLGQLFDRMYRAAEAERRHIQGTGLGLTIVKAIVDAHEATIAVSSELGKGTTFRVVLPKRMRTEAGDAPPPMATNGRPAADRVND